MIIFFVDSQEKILKFFGNNGILATYPIAEIDSIKVGITEANEKSLKIHRGNELSELSVANIDSIKIEEQIKINPEDVPDNEIWYMTTDGGIMELTMLFDSNPNLFSSIISNTYKNGKGVLRFKHTLTDVEQMFGAPGSGFPEKLLYLFLPNTIKTIKDGAFYCCSNMKELKLPKGCERIESNAFLECQSLINITIPETVNYFGNAVFGGCSRLENFDGANPYITPDRKCIIYDNELKAVAMYGITEYTIPEGVTKISAYSFLKSSLEKVYLPSSTRSIGSMAFDSSKIKEVELNEGLISIEDYAFRNSNLSSVHIPSTVETIENAAFSCDNMSLFTGKYASSDGKCLIIDGEIISFAYKGLTSYELPPETKIVGPNLFNSPTLESVVIPEGVEVIEGNAFTAVMLRTINIPSTVISIGSYSCGPFTYCVNLESITGKYTTEDNRCLIKDDVLISFAPKGLSTYTVPEGIKAVGGSVFREHYLDSIILPSSLTEIRQEAFNGSTIKTITIPENVSSIESFAFSQCSNLSSVYVRAYIPPRLDSLYETYVPGSTFGIAENGVIYVPIQSYQSYVNCWSAYADKIVGYYYPDLPYDDTYFSTDYSQDGTVTTLQTASVGEGIDIVLMGDAYSDRQIADGTYAKDMEYIYDNLFTEEPYKSFKDHFNVHYVNVVSATEGYEYGNTALDGYFGDGTLVGGNDNAVFTYAHKAISANDMDEALIIVAMNSDNYAGTCYMYYPEGSSDYGKGVSVAYFPRGGDEATFAQLLHHEACGHGFAKLADEYAYEYMGIVPSDYMNQIKEQQTDWGWWKNVDFTSDLNTIRWSHFLNDSRYANEGLGAFEGGLTYWNGVWRPTENSIMRYNTGGFNAPSREAIYYRIHKLAYGDDWQYDYEKFAEWDAKNRTEAANTARMKAKKPANYKPTHPPVIVNKSWKDAWKDAK